MSMVSVVCRTGILGLLALFLTLTCGLLLLLQCTVMMMKSQARLPNYRTTSTCTNRNISYGISLLVATVAGTADVKPAICNE